VTFLNDHRDELYEVELYLVLVYEGIQTRHPSTRLQGLFQHPRRALHEWLSTHAVLHLLERDLDRAVAQLHQKAAAFEVQLADSARPTRLGKADTFRFFRRLVNYTAADDAVLKYDTHLDYFVADSPVDCHRTHLDVGEAHVKVLTMKEPPAGTYAHLLEDLYTVPGEFIACLQWHRIPNDRMRRDIQARRRHFFNQRVSMVNYLAATDPRPEEALVHSPADQTVTDLGQALTELEVRGHFFGECSLTVVLFDRDPQVVARAAAEAVKVMATHDGTLVAETYNLLNAWLAVVPGNSAHNLRRLALLETNIADLSFLFTLDTGARVSPHLGREALATFETRHHTPYFFNLHVDDVGHTVAVGMTGSGKSVLLKFLTTHAQKYRPNTYIFDLGDGYRKLATRLGGSYVDIGLRQRDVSINPFALQPTPENLHFLHAFVRVLLEGTDTLDVFLFKAVCGNHIIWGFQHVAGFRRRHVGASIQTAWTASMDTVRAALDADTANDRALLLRSISQELGGTRDAVMETAVRRLDISQKQAAEAYALAEEHESNPRSIWGYVQGLTRLSQRTPWQDGRYALDRAASRLLTTVQ
jgi:type IV secretion system protein VirB4